VHFVANRKVTIPHPMAATLGRIARRHGVKLYVVGGYVRDLLRGAPSNNDVDFTVEGSGVEFGRIVAEELGSHVVVYERFGTALVPAHGFKLEFVGTRQERYEEHSRKPIVTEGTLADDLRRRDFTVNALAIPVNDDGGEIIDLFDGLGDLERRLLRTPLEPHTTYSEDPLRMMRAARFTAQLGFDLDPASHEAICDMRERIAIVSQERISDEFIKTLASPRPGVGLTILYETGLMEVVFPEVYRLGGVDLVHAGGASYAHKDVFRHTVKVVDNIAEKTDNVWLRFAALMHDIAKPKTKRFIEGTGWTFHGHDEIGARWQDRIFRRMKLPLKERDYVATLVRMHHRPMALVDEGVTDAAIRRLVVDAGEYLDDLFTLCRADITSRDARRVRQYLGNYDRVVERILEVQEKDRLRAFQSPVRGEEIMEICGVGPSRVVGVLKKAIEEAILDGRIPNEYEAARDYLLTIKDEVLREAPAK
jgi:putative nucleotidyltransferase with HDIG domain